MPFRDYYQILQVSPTAGAEAIQAAYRAACKTYHPDTGRPDASAERMVLINEAYAVLSDDRRRSEYDKGYVRRRRRPATGAVARPGDRYLVLTPDLSVPLARVPAGEFLMSGTSTASCRHDRDACRAGLYSVYLPEYYIGIHPVTIAQYGVFAAATRRPSTPWARRSLSFDPGELEEPETIARLDRNWQHPFGGQSSVAEKEDHPVVIVTWFDAMAFCKWASDETGANVRLPSAAEWQKAARGTDGRCYPWGDSPQPGRILCNCSPDEIRTALSPEGDTTPVGAFGRAADSPYGCSDMLGNVWEWTATRTRDREGNVLFGDRYDPADGREKPDGRDLRMLMGGSFNSPCASVCCAAQRDQEPLRARDTGFRVCVTF